MDSIGVSEFSDRLEAPTRHRLDPARFQVVKTFWQRFTIDDVIPRNVFLDYPYFTMIFLDSN